MRQVDGMSIEEFAHLLHRSLRMVDPPQALTRTAIRAFPRASLAGAVRKAARVIAASLTFDSRDAPGLALGMRSTGGAVRQMVFGANDRDVDLRITANGGRRTLEGQILGRDEPGFVEIRIDDEDVRTTALDACGGFRLDDVGGGRCRMTLRFADAVVDLPTIEIL